MQDGSPDSADSQHGTRNDCTMTAVLDHGPSTTDVVAPDRSKRRRPSTFKGDLVLVLIALETGIAIGLGLLGQPWSDWTAVDTGITALSRVLAMTGTAFALVSILLSARIPWLENAVGQDRLVRWHRTLGPYSLWMVFAHVLLVTFGYAMLDNTNVWIEFWNITLTMSWMVPALAGFIAMMMIGVTSYRKIRGKLKYETWWTIHLYAYLAIALSFMHQIETGTMFTTNPAATRWWVMLNVLTFGAVLWFRIITPLIVSVRHDLRVERVIVENHNTISVIMKGRNLHKLAARGGQFFGWRFLAKRYWWESHPYSLSAVPRNDRMRITVKFLGDHSRWMADLKPGTRVLVEGPYGVFTADHAVQPHVTLIAGGVGVTPIRALLEELPADARITIIWRASTEADLMLRDEVEAFAAQRNADVHYLVGSRQHVALDVRTLARLAPNIKYSDVFLCGPEPVVEQAIASAIALGVPKQQIHDEAFAY